MALFLPLDFTGFSLKDAEGDSCLKGKVSIHLDYEQNSRQSADSSSQKRNNLRKLLNFSIIDDGIGWFCKIELDKGIVDGGLKGMIERVLLDNRSCFFLYVFEGPNAIVC